MPRPCYLVGSTAVGKSSLAVEIAERCGAEIVGADAFQVYRGLDVLTAKPSREQLRRVPHHLIGTLPLDTEYNVARYADDARRCLAEIAARGRPALVVGGSGLYVRALTHGLSPLPPAQQELRADLEPLDLSALLARLRSADPAALAVIDLKNKRRVIRAIEICETTGQPWSATRALWQEAEPPPGARRGLLLTRDRADLNAAIAGRVQSMVADGLLTEVRATRHEECSTTSRKIIGLEDVWAHLRGETTLDACLTRIEQITRQYAKRQMTWFRGKSSFPVVNLSAVAPEEVIAQAVALVNAGPAEEKF